VNRESATQYSVNLRMRKGLNALGAGLQARICPMIRGAPTS
jgi:hypothetical protein